MASNKLRLLAFCDFTGSRAVSAGTSDKATKEEMITEPARTPPNSRNNRPAVEGRKAIGINTDASTAVVAITAKNTSRVPITAAALAPKPIARRR